MVADLTDATVVPWGYELFKHMDETHGLILTLSELQEIVRIAARLREPPHCPSCDCGSPSSESVD